MRRAVALTFVRNRGELAEGWYDPTTLQKAQASTGSEDHENVIRNRRQQSPIYNSINGMDEDSDEDEVGPAPFANSYEVYNRKPKSGPAIPNMQDMDLQRGRFPEAPATDRRGLILF